MIRAEVFDAEPGFESFHGHAQWHLCAVLAGGFEEVIGGAGTICEAGAVRVSRPDAHHDLYFADGAQCLVLEAEGAFWSGLLARTVLDSVQHRFGAATLPLLQAVRDALRTEALDGRLHGCFVLGEVIASLRPARAPDWAGDAQAAISESDGRISLSNVAAEAGLARADFARGFQQLYGFRPVEYRALQRLRCALPLVSDEDMPLAEAALAAGYAHQSHMTNAFRTILGQTPGAVRRSGLQICKTPAPASA